VPPERLLHKDRAVVIEREKRQIMKKLEGKVAIITGATSGMALATAKLFVEEGAYVFITGRRQQQLDEAVKAIGKDVTGVQGDAGKLADLDRLYETVKAKKGHLDILFASAGAGDFGVPIGSVSEENFDKTFDVNVRGTLFTVQKALPLMRDGGSIILNGSIASMKGFPGMSVYNASKAAVRSFARTWTNDLKDRKIRVNVISPGSIDTAVFVGVPKEVKDQFISLIPMGRIGESEEIARAALFLASNDSSFVTGIELFVDGGTAQV
jgi:NAD(P)-dependent dehydrogenase (short-subunit alcohol dehydrogenase family)